MVAQRIFLGVFGGIFLAAGIFTFFDPHTMGEALGIVPIDFSGETELRATYGGLVAGSGLLLVGGLFSRELAIAALAGTVFGGGGLMFTRLIIEVFFGEPGIAVNQGIIIVFELAMISFAYVLLRRAIRDYRQSASAHPSGS
ncbi:MAG: hypothetical protein OXI44_05425 [Bacteroidota bacterium]|nr:hypothetical protein [Bacteroidota bacterium]